MNNQYEQFFKLSCDLFAIADSEGFLLQTNPAFKTHFGITTSFTEKVKFIELIHPDDQTTFQKILLDQQSTPFSRLKCNCSEMLDSNVIWNFRFEKELCYISGKDVSKQYAAHEELFQYKRFFEMSLDLFCIVDHDGHFKKLNNSFTKVLGWNDKDLKNKSFSDLVHTEDRAETLAEFDKLRHGESSTGFENRCITKNKEWKWMHWTCYPNTATDEYFVIAHDINEVRSALDTVEQLREKYELKDKYEAELNAINSSVLRMELTPEGKILSLNEKFLELLGFEREDIENQDHQSLLFENDFNGDSYHEFWEKLKNGIPQHQEFRLKGNKEIAVWIKSYYIPVKDRGRHISKIIKIAYDITERILIQKQLEEQRKRLDYVIKGTNLGTWEWNVQTGETIFNERWANIIGYKLEELSPISIDTWTRFAHPEDLEKSAVALQNHFEGKTEFYNFESRMKHRDGHWIWVYDRGKVASWTEDGQPLWMYGTHHEITERKTLEKKLKEAKEMAECSASAKDIFLANMSHEIRTPLNAIIGFTDLLKKSSLNQIQSKYVDTITIASKNLLVLINDILDISKIESGRLELEKKPFSIKKLINDTVKLNSQTAKTKQIKLISIVDHEIPDFVLGDSTRLMQILVNLIGNAIKFTQKGNVEVMSFLKKESEKHVRISFKVKDTGIGIAKEKIQSIFERFTQAESSTTREYGGSGLGLNIVKMLVQLHNGQLKIKSKVGKGSEISFEINFPLVNSLDMSIEEVIAEKNEIGQLDNLKVLIVEDNEHNQILASTYISKNNGIVDLAENGKVGVEKAKQRQYDIILMDLQMPKMDGFEASKYILEKVDKSVPIVACTAHSAVEEKNKAIAHGMVDCITKPYSEQELVNTILKYGKKVDTLTKNNRNHGSSDDFLEILKNIETEEGPDFIKAMLDVFNRKIPDYIHELREALNDKEWKSVNQKAHIIAGSLSSLNFKSGYELAKEVEITSLSEVPEDIEPQANKLIHYLENALKEIKN
ncbi:PAS domain-containing protein [Limibacter armeniacum]|uniref:PAS domain-containing protein n=1 Tax=Limibacter armeniacum TaxID=466084 RepID=UPI002FE583D0